MTVVFKLSEFRNALTSNELELSSELTVVPKEESNKDNVENSKRSYELRKISKRLVELDAEADACADKDDEEGRNRAIAEAAELNDRTRDVLIETLATRIVERDTFKAVTVAQLKKCVGGIREAQALLDIVAGALALDPQTLVKAPSGEATT